MPFDPVDTSALARALAQIAERDGDLADLFLERSETIEVPPAGEAPGFRVRREAGLAVRLTRGDVTWLCSRDEITGRAFREALRRVARAMPRAPLPEARLEPHTWEPPEAPELLELPGLIAGSLRNRRAPTDTALRVHRHRRWVQTIGPRVASPPQSESYYSLSAEAPWGRWGTLLAEVGRTVAGRAARDLVEVARMRSAGPPERSRGAVVLGPGATAVLLHEAVSHALEADTLALAEGPEAAIGGSWSPPGVSVIDDPASAPAGVRRTVDDEGIAVLRRWLLRDGIVEQPLCDATIARRSDRLAAGAARRGNRHLPPGPRSTHLELLPGTLPLDELLAAADGGLLLPEAERGHLDPVSGFVELRFPGGRRIRRGVSGPTVGRCRLRARLSDLLAAVQGIGETVESAGAGWCAKGGVRLPVWATAPHLLLEGLEVGP